MLVLAMELAQPAEFLPCLAQAMKRANYLPLATSLRRIVVELVGEGHGRPASELAAELRAAPEQRGGPLAAFDAARINSDYQIREWAPGRRVAIELPSPDRAKAWRAAAGAAAVPLALAALTVLGAVMHPSGARIAPQAAAFTAGWLGLAAVAGLFAARALWRVHRQSAILDWGTRQLVLKRGSSERTVPLEEVRCFVLRGRKSVAATAGFSRGGGGYTRTLYWCELEVEVAGAGELLLATRPDVVHGGPGASSNDLTSDAAEASYRSCAPLAAELSRYLGIEWRWEEYE